MAFNTTESTLTNATVAPSDCIVLQYDEFIPWDNPDNIVSSQTVDLIRRLKELVFLPIMFLIGAPANVINMAVFYKQGLKERINVCLFALSLADGLYLVCNMMWYGEQLFMAHNSKDTIGPVLQWMTNNYLLGFYGFTWVSQILSAIIASERCFCVLQPLRSRSVLKTSTTTVIIIIVFMVVTGVFFIISLRYYIVCAYDPVSESVIMTWVGGEFYHRHQKLVDFFDVFVYGVGIPGLVIVVVVITSIVTVIKLRQAAGWRAQTSSRGCSGDGDGGNGMSAGEIALTKMLLCNSVFFIICVFPIGFCRFLQLFMPEINAGRRHHNLYLTLYWLLNCLTYMNATFNIVIYYTVGSRFRQSFHHLLSCRLKTPRASKKVIGDTSGG